MIKREDNKVIVHHMEGMAKFTGVADAGYLLQMNLLSAKKHDQIGGSLSRKAKYDPMVDLILGCVSRDPAQYRKATLS
jgi:hypothetical protein